MGVYRRPDSHWWWLWLETAPPGQQKEKTAIRVGTTVTQRHDSKHRAEQVYHQRMQELAVRVHRLPLPRPVIRFADYAAHYQTQVIAHHKGHVREVELLAHLVAFFGDELLAAIDHDRVRAYMTARRSTAIGRTRARTVSANTVNREVDLLKAMLRDAVPKYLDASPVMGMKRLTIVKTRRRLLQAAEETRLLAVATDPQDYALIVLGLDTLVRLGDLLDLRRDDRDGLWLTIRDPKMNEPYEVPLSARAATALDAISHDRPFYFEKFRRAQNPRDWRGSVRQRLEQLCAIATPPVPFGPGGITFHGTRKTGATRLLVEKALPVAVVQKIGNWRTPDVLLGIYTEVQRGDLLAAVGHPNATPTPGTLPKKAKAVRMLRENAR